MIRTIKTIENLLVFAMSDTITAQDIEAVYDLMTKKLASGEVISVYAELTGDFAMEGGALFKDFARAHEIIGRMKQFDRIAFVASESWIRAIALTESRAFSLTGINMQVYEPGEREHALAWAKGQMNDEHALSVSEIDTDRPETMAFEIDGKMRAEDLDTAKAILARIISSDHPTRLLARIKSFKGFELAMLADGDLVAMKRASLNHLQRYAIVGPPSWMASLVNSIGSALTVQIKLFQIGDEDSAWAWIKEDLT